VRPLDGRRRLPRRPESWWPTLRIALVVLWVAWAALSWWYAPRDAGVARARADLAAGRVVSHQWGDGWDDGGVWRWPDPPQVRSWDDVDGPIFVWQTSDRRIRYAVADESSSGEYHLDGTVDPSRYSGPEAASLAQAVRSAELDPAANGFSSRRPALALVTLLVGLGLLGLLVAGPRPVIGTRWFWFWLVSGVPFGLGLLYWLARENPWSPNVKRPTGALGPAPRHRGYVGLAVALVTAVAGGLLVVGLNRLLGDGLVPHPRP